MAAGRRILHRPFKNMLRVALGAVLSATVLTDAHSKAKRDPAQRAIFVKTNPCPATAKTRGTCPGYVVDHVVPLCAGGRDHWTNMQWQREKREKEGTRLNVKCAEIDGS